MLKQENKSLHNINIGLKVDVETYKQLLEETKKILEDQKEDLKKRKDLIKLLNNNIQNYWTRIEQLEKLITNIIDSRINTGFKFYDSLISDIKELFYWPLSMVEMDKPWILPSGISIHEEYWDKLENSQSRDPYNKNLKVKQKIINRFAIEVKEIIQQSEKSLENEFELRESAERGKLNSWLNTKSVEIQTYFLIKLEDDIDQINNIFIQTFWN